MSQPDLPSRELLDRQAAWLAPARARLLRRVEIARRKSVLDLACGHGAVTEELARRCAGRVVALDCNPDALRSEPTGFVGATVLCGKAEQLPLADGAFDLVFCQFAFLWIDVPAALREIRRVLMPGGVLAAIEPDYGGLIEHPPEIAVRDLWLSALRRAGADPLVGRKLPGLLAAAGFDVQVDLLDHLAPPSPMRFEFLRGLPLDDTEKAALERAIHADSLLTGRQGRQPIRASGRCSSLESSREDELLDSSGIEALRVAHLPLFLIRAAVCVG